MLTAFMGVSFLLAFLIFLFVGGSSAPLERIKQSTDSWLSRFLRSTSYFGRELTGDGLEDQQWLQRIRLRDLHHQAPTPITNPRHRIVVLGGGSGGLVAATQLARTLGARHEVTLVDRSSDHIFMPAFLFLMVGARRPQDITRKLQRLERHNVKVLQAEIEGIDPQRQEVILESGPLPYDHLIISLGMRTAPELLPGFTEAAEHSWELDAALSLQKSLRSFESGRILIGVPSGPYRCPPAPYEAQWMLDSYFKERGLRDKVELEFFTTLPEPAGEERTPAVWMDAQSKKRGVKQHYSFTAQSIDPERHTVKGLYGVELPYDLLFMVPPHEPARALVDSGLPETRNGIRVDFDSMATRWSNVYAIGDCADMPVSKSGGVAHQQAEVVAHNLAVELTGEGEPKTLHLHVI
jgi:sulfide:quinone oxidoreductase